MDRDGCLKRPDTTHLQNGSRHLNPDRLELARLLLARRFLKRT
jgi:hypothetical protein